MEKSKKQLEKASGDEKLEKLYTVNIIKIISVPYHTGEKV